MPDPEIPVLSVIDLGIVRDVDIDNGRVTVKITPTYTGCPATSVIALDIQTALLKKGVESISVKTVLSPAWTTDWLSESGREKLKNYGIAPPQGSAATCAGLIGASLFGARVGEPALVGMEAKAAPHIICPHCASENTEMVSQFGSTPCKASYRCKSCLEPFDYFKAF